MELKTHLLAHLCVFSQELSLLRNNLLHVQYNASQNESSCQVGFDPRDASHREKINIDPKTRKTLDPILQVPNIGYYNVTWTSSMLLH